MTAIKNAYIDLAATVHKAAQAHRDVAKGIATHAEAERARRDDLHQQLVTKNALMSPEIGVKTL